MESDLGLWSILVAIIGGAIRVSTPFLFVSLGELLTERSGRINLGLEGTLVFGAMSGYAVAFLTGSAWAGVGAAAMAGALFGILHGVICSIPRVNDIAIGIALVFTLPWSGIWVLGMLIGLELALQGFGWLAFGIGLYRLRDLG